nr:RNA-binding protein [Vibrio parahaemolyticus]
MRKEKTKQFVETLMAEQGIDHINMIKPGIAEATRILLRRVPDFIMLKNVKSDDVSHLIQMAKKANVKIIENDAMPFQACAVIKKVTD